MAETLNVRKVFEAIAEILGDREGIRIEVVSVEEGREEEKDLPVKEAAGMLPHTGEIIKDGAFSYVWITREGDDRG